MLRKFYVTLILILSVAFLGLGPFKSNSYIMSGNKYVGTKTCSMCHKQEKIGKQYVIWQNSKHAQAYKTLQTKEADKVAKDKGFKTKAVDTPECLKCHASGYDVEASLLTPKFKIEDGVQCETCHGPGSEYKSKKVMEDKKLAVEKGLIIYDNPETLCMKCHNEESPFYKGFNFKERWAQIKHSVPNK